ncbi:MAG: NAD-binding protein [Planctomycetota bacterium]|nr:NAD-binding protein [Planctomycetota bacterium]
MADETEIIEQTTPAKRAYDPWRFFTVGMVMLLSLIVVSTVVYYLLGFYYGKPWGIKDCLFMVIITLSTIGYGDWLKIQEIPGNELIMAFTMFLILAGMGVPAFLIANVTALIVDGIIGDTFRRRRMQQEIAKLSGHVVVCGAGGTGEHCIEELVKLNRKFVVIDHDEERLKTLQHAVGEFPYVVGHAERDEVLTQAGVARATGLVCALADDKANLFITLSARVLNPDLRIVTKGVDDHVRKKMVIAGANAVVSPTAIGGLRMISELLRPATTGFLDTMLRQRTSFRFDELVVGKGSGLAGKTLAQSELRQIADVLVVAARHPGQENFIYNPKADFLLEPDCVIVVLGQVAEVDKLRPLFAGNG